MAVERQKAAQTGDAAAFDRRAKAYSAATSRVAGSGIAGFDTSRRFEAVAPPALTLSNAATYLRAMCDAVKRA